MKKEFKITYILLIFTSLLFSCRQTKYVPEGKYLLKKNKIEFIDKGIDADDVTEVIRQKANFKTFGFKLKLWAFNRIDSTSVANKRFRKNVELRQKNQRLLAKQDRINSKRIDRARRKNKDLYTEKTLTLKDTTSPKSFFREWFKYKVGEKPSVFDSIPFNKSIDQLGILLKNKGYYYGNVTGNVRYKKNKKAIVKYTIFHGNQYIIDSVYINSTNSTVTAKYREFLKKSPDKNLVGKPFDKDVLNEHRNDAAKFMRDNLLYGFSSSHINFIADTNYATMKVVLGVRFTDRLVKSQGYKDSMVPIKFKETFVKNVYFHISDTSNFKGNFRQTVEQMGLSLMDGNFVNTIDTFYYAELKLRHSDSLDKKRMATFYFNEKMAIDPGLLECQNYLEEENAYKEYYLERTFSRLLQLDLFQVIKPVIVEIPNSKYVDVHYYLVPNKKQSFGFEPRATNSNGFLGVAASVNYTNKNAFGGGEKFVFSISGGFESQPPVFAQTLDGQQIKQAGRSFNTFEIGPSFKFDIPGLFPTKVTRMSKRQRPRTVISTAYNYQSRNDFKRHIFQLNYLWRFYVGKTQVFQAGLPFVSIIKFVRIDKSPSFESKLNLLNDLFLRNAYSDQFIWQDWKLTFEYNNKDKDDKKSNLSVYMNATVDPAGNTLSMFRRFQDTIANGQYAIFGVGYSQFARMDGELIMSNPTGKNKSLHGRLQIGGGRPYGNTTTSLPYDYSFFAGGANDNRGWRARALGPGSYKYYLDTNRTATQIGDIRIGSSLEFRFAFGPVLKGAIFVDAGNVWTFNEDVNRIGSKFSSNWYKEIAISSGVGLRLDLDFFIIRLDIGLPLTNPALPNGEKWIFQSKDQFYAEGLAKFGATYKTYLPNPYIPNIHFGIGYPF